MRRRSAPRFSPPPLRKFLPRLKKRHPRRPPLLRFTPVSVPTGRKSQPSIHKMKYALIYVGLEEIKHVRKVQTSLDTPTVSGC